MALDTQESTPLYQQIIDSLYSDISNGVYKKGEKLPTEQELSKKYGVSRVTVRNALAELTSQGLLSRQKGRGTFVTSEKISRSISGVHSFSEICRSIGTTPGAKVIKCTIEDATDEDIAALILPEGSSVVVVERIRYSDDVPVSLEISRFPETFTFLLQEDLNNCSMFELLKTKYNIGFENSEKTIELTYASHQLAIYLQVPFNHPLILISSISRDLSGTPSHRSFQYIVGDKFKLIV